LGSAQAPTAGCSAVIALRIASRSRSASAEPCCGPGGDLLEQRLGVDRGFPPHDARVRRTGAWCVAGVAVTAGVSCLARWVLAPLIDAAVIRTPRIPVGALASASERSSPSEVVERERIAVDGNHRGVLDSSLGHNATLTSSLVCLP
jgi:hypothetical protein